MTRQVSLNGLILNGGASKRMGAPKGEISYHNKPQQQHLFEILTKLCDAVYFSVKEKTESFPFPQIEDKQSFESPLNGIYSAMKSIPCAWLVVAIDMPLLNSETFSFLLSQRDISKVATCFYDSSGKRPEPLVSIWEPHTLSLLENFIASGNESPRNFLEQNDTNLIVAPNPDVLLNVNSKEELALYRKNQKF